jgi:hypothetical protein
VDDCTITNGDGEFLKLRILARPHSADPDDWSRNILRAEVSFGIGGLNGSVTGELFADELAWFTERHRALYDTLTGEADMQTLENWLDLQVTTDGKGHLAYRCVLVGYEPSYRVEFELHTDQTFVRSALDQLGSMVAEYPGTGVNPIEPRDARRRW